MGGGFSGGGGGFSMDDIFSQFGDIFGDNDMFGSFLGGGGRRGSQRRSVGSNIRIKLKLSLGEMRSGVEKKVRYRRMTDSRENTWAECPTCGGSGAVRRVTNTFLGQMATSSNATDSAAACAAKPKAPTNTALYLKMLKPVSASRLV
jgi:molecular chaperone DnaJ